MGRGEYMKHVVLADTIGPELTTYAERFAEQAESLWTHSSGLSSGASLYDRFPFIGEAENRIIEDFIEKQGCSSDTDCFSENGTLKFVSFCAQRFDLHAANPYTPAAYSWPSTFTQEQESYLTAEIQRLITLLGMKTVVYNIETRIAPNGKPYIMELTPRGGGNRLCEMLRYATGVDMITAITRFVVGDSVPTIEQKPYNGHWAEIILHADKDGIFDRLVISKELPAEVIEEDLWVKKGDKVESFEGANNAIGTLVLRFNTVEELENAITNQSEWLNVKVK